MQVTITTEADKLNVVIHGEIDHHSVTELRDSVDGQILQSRPQTIRLDFSGVTFMDSSGIGFIMGRYKLAREYGGRVVVAGTGKKTRTILEMAGLARYVTIL
ncbi:STAS domain-containing protein [Feifania hominis]|uniref:Anti-sigma factor antagonist n=1 Tax=Feifania hominis TaxID=2763660 RepID=A0A926DCT1_9FIRM|nr:STAS domain-containing protein [Feifania hominis]MBC8535449.1 STAS domain-containing protein [Feifania hominis]